MKFAALGCALVASVVGFPGAEDLDAPIRSAIVGFANALTMTSPIADCHRPAAVLIGTIPLSSGAVTLRNAPVGPPSPTPAARPTP